VWHEAAGTVVLAEDHPLVADALAGVLEGQLVLLETVDSVDGLLRGARDRREADG
jgi:hypothetical protein